MGCYYSEKKIPIVDIPTNMMTKFIPRINCLDLTSVGSI